MPQAARDYHDQEVTTPVVATASAVWAGEAHGPVGALHRAIEERMLAGAELVAVMPLRPRPGEALVRMVSRLAGWSAVAGCGLGALALLAH